MNPRGDGDRFTRGLLLCGLITPVELVVFVVWADLATPGYSQLADSVSQLGAQGRPHPEIMSAGFVIFGLLVNGFAYGLFRGLPSGRAAFGVWGGLSGFGTGILLTGLFQDYDETPGVPTNTEGDLHSLFAQLAVASLIVGMFFFARAVYEHPGWPHATRFSFFAAIAVAGFGLLFMVVPSSVEGLPQRAGFATGLIWIVFVAVASLRQREMASGSTAARSEHQG